MLLFKLVFQRGDPLLQRCQHSVLLLAVAQHGLGLEVGFFQGIAGQGELRGGIGQPRLQVADLRNPGLKFFLQLLNGGFLVSRKLDGIFFGRLGVGQGLLQLGNGLLGSLQPRC